MGANGWSELSGGLQALTDKHSSFLFLFLPSVLPVPGWFSIREAEANIQGSAGFGPEQYGRQGGGVQGRGGVAGQKENKMLPVVLIRHSKGHTSDVFPLNKEIVGKMERKLEKERERESEKA